MLTFEQMLTLNRAAGARDYSHRIIHYTSENSLLRILDSNELWFGRIDQMNDASEYTHYWNAVEKVLAQLLPQVSEEELKESLAVADGHIRNAAFISSWCEYFDDTPEGSLQMWRAYGDAGRGVAAVIDSSQLQPSVLTPNKLQFFINSSKVQYVKSDDVQATAEALLADIYDSGVLANVPNAHLTLGIMLAAKAPTSKHHSFREEQEIRFLALPKFSQITNRFVPEGCERQIESEAAKKDYFALPLKKWEEFDFDLRLSTVLKKVLIGPLNDPEERQRRVRSHLDQIGLNNVDTEIVDIPLRD